MLSGGQSQFGLVSVHQLQFTNPPNSPLLLVRSIVRLCYCSDPLGTFGHTAQPPQHPTTHTLLEPPRASHPAVPEPRTEPTKSLQEGVKRPCGCIAAVSCRLLPLPWQHQPTGDQTVFLRGTAGKDRCVRNTAPAAAVAAAAAASPVSQLHPSVLPACTTVVSALPQHHSHRPAAAAAAPDTPPHRPPLPLPPNHQVARLVSL